MFLSLIIRNLFGVIEIVLVPTKKIVYCQRQFFLFVSNFSEKCSSCTNVFVLKEKKKKKKRKTIALRAGFLRGINRK